MAEKYDYRNQNKGKLNVFIENFVTHRAFHETESIYDFIVSSYVKHSPGLHQCELLYLLFLPETYKLHWFASLSSDFIHVWLYCTSFRNYFDDGSDPSVTSTSPFPGCTSAQSNAEETWSHSWPKAVWRCFIKGTISRRLCVNSCKPVCRKLLTRNMFVIYR